MMSPADGDEAARKLVVMGGQAGFAAEFYWIKNRQVT